MAETGDEDGQSEESGEVTAPDTAALERLFAGAARARFTQHPILVARSETPRTLLTVEAAELAELAAVMALTPGPGPHCMCMGDMMLEVEDAAGQALARISLHHGQTLRWEGPWSWADAAFADPERFIDWLAARGVEDYALQQAHGREQAQQSQRERARWVAAMPACLRSRVAELEVDGVGLPRRLDRETLDGELARLRAALGEDAAVARALLIWFGQGAGPWSGYPSYEDLAEQLLLRLGTDAVLAAAAAAAEAGASGREQPDDEALIAGLARYFGSWNLRRAHRSHPQRVPSALRERLLAHVRAQEIGDNLERLQAAFRPGKRPSALASAGSGLVCVHPDRSMAAVAVGGGWIYAVEPFAVVRFAPGGEPEPVLSRERVFASLAVDDDAVYIALIDGEIWRVGHADAQATLLADGRSRSMGLHRRGSWLTWLDQPWIPDPVRGPPYSSARTIVCGLSTRGGVVGEYGSIDGGGWDPAIVGDRVAWVRGGGEASEVLCVRAPGGTIETLIDDLGEVDADGGFAHLASTGDDFIVAVPTRSWLRAGVELRRYDGEGQLRGRIDFVAGRFNGLDAGEHGVALLVERGGELRAQLWDPQGRTAKLAVPRQPGPLVKPTVAADGAYFAVGSDLYRVARP